eukprot:gnl/Spiro4/3397_TR1649_c0_g1_i1.p1 gnl/Spiro4/3397_TR1649_c0_g1~~gnl/Spiro4/3397_TR1649_c0_g1_i1.p1  ORF type:complete len:333 (-),score=65.23 gnl/Spiro4/3397_TR1649_c0_g1_i1:88-1020(-)
MHLAAREGDLKLVKQQLQHEHVDSLDRYGSTPLMSAAQNGQTKIMEFLVNAGANVQASNKYGVTALISCVKGEFLESAQFLLSKQADVNVTTVYGQTPIHLAAQIDSLPMVQLLLQNGAVCYVRDDNGKLPSELVPQGGKVKALLEAQESEDKRELELVEQGGLAALPPAPAGPGAPAVQSRSSISGVPGAVVAAPHGTHTHSDDRFDDFIELHMEEQRPENEGLAAVSRSNRVPSVQGQSASHLPAPSQPSRTSQQQLGGATSTSSIQISFPASIVVPVGFGQDFEQRLARVEDKLDRMIEMLSRVFRG